MMGVSSGPHSGQVGSGISVSPPSPELANSGVLRVPGSIH